MPSKPPVPTLARFVLQILILALLVPLPLRAQEEPDDGRTLHWREIAVAARLDAEGRLHVRERQAMVFDGAWNGGEREFDLRLGQQLRLNGLTRIEPATGARTPLTPGGLERIDEWDWTDDETLRWRSRLESDPPFRNQEIVYELDYTLWPVLVPAADGGYLLRHDFAFADRAGVIEHFEVDLALDAAWAAPGSRRIREAADGLAPGRGYTVTLPLRYMRAGEPAAVPEGAPGWVRALVASAALLVPLLVFLGLRRRSRELDRIAPLTEPEVIDQGWLESHLFRYPAEIVGTAWDSSVGQAEVAALLARLVAEGKLASRVETDGGKPVLHLERVAALGQFAEHERKLLEGLFFDGGEQTDTEAIRRHYKSKGFDPASRIRKELSARLETLSGPGRVKRTWAPAAGVMIAGAVMLFLPGPPGNIRIAVLGLLLSAVAAMFALAFAATLARRVTYRTGPVVGVMLPLLVLALLLALLAAGGLEGEGALAFFRPGASLLGGLLVVLSGVGLLAVALSQPSETAERLAFRRRLVSARQFFERELGRPEPRLQDTWFPYLLAFGLGPHIDRWFRAFGGRDNVHVASPGLVAAGAKASGQSGSAWTGGGPQFGGGSFGGGGAGGTWSVAAAGMAAGVSSPSSGGGGASSSGGGGGGGW